MTGNCTPIANPLDLSPEEQQFLLHYRGTCEEGQRTFRAMIKIIATSYPAKKKPHLRIVGATSIKGVHHA